MSRGVDGTDVSGARGTRSKMRGGGSILTGSLRVRRSGAINISRRLGWNQFPAGCRYGLVESLPYQVFRGAVR